MERIFLAGGCFWGVEEYFRRTEGIEGTLVGYINSQVPDPSYEEVLTGRTRAAEGLRLDYDPEVISRQDIVDHFYSIIDPHLFNRQGMDIGTQYRTGLYFTSEEEGEAFKEDLKARQARDPEKIYVEVLPLENFYPAEDYHQAYLRKNPGGYCHIPLPEMKGDQDD